MRDIRVEPSAIRDTARRLREVGEGAQTSVDADSVEMEALAQCWGADAAGTAFGAAYCPVAADTLANVLERPRQVEGFAGKLDGAAAEHEATENDNAALAQGATHGEGR